jgi:TonB family protein
LERYRVLSLVALGRDNEASQVIERIVGEDPLYVPDQADTPPRVRVAFRDARRRLLPDIAKKKYASGKASFDLKEYSSAAAELERAIRIIDDPDVGEPAGLRDLRVLAAGFLDLSTATLSTIVEPVAPPALVPATASTEPATKPPPSPSIGKVVPPVPVRESMPGWQASGRGVRLRYSGALQITIDEKGDVESATILSPLHPEYNRLLLQATRSWKYQPAEKDGKPIKFVKIIPVELEP